MSEAITLPAPLGDRQRTAPYTHLPTSNVTKVWRLTATRYNTASDAWRRELLGIAPDGHHRDRVRDLATYRRLRNGEPSTFAAYDTARADAMATVSGSPEALKAKVQLAAEMLGLADPWNAWMKASGRSSTDARAYTKAEILFAMLWQEALAVSRATDALREEVKALRKAADRA